MSLSETYLGIGFSIHDNENGTWAWSSNKPMDARHPEKSTAIIPGGQNEAILAARRAIGLHLRAASQVAPR